MARKRREPSPPPPPLPPPQVESSGSEEDEEPSPAPAPRNPQQNPQPAPPNAAANGDDGDTSEEDEGTDSDTDAQDFQLRQVTRSPGKPPAPQLRGRAAEGEEESGSSESEPEIPEPVQKNTAAARKSKAEDRKRSAALEPAPSGKANKAKADAGKASPELTPPSKVKNPGGKLEKAKVDPSPSSKSEKGKRPPRTWSRDDEIKILEAIAAHIKSDGALPKTETLIALVGDQLNRESCNYTDMYEKVRTLKKRYQKVSDTGVVPSNEDDIHIYNLSEAVWGEKAKEAIAAATSQNDGAVKESKKVQGIKEKVDTIPKDGTSKSAHINITNQNDAALKASKRGHEKEKTDRNVKSRLVKEATTTATPSTSKKQGRNKEELDEAAKGSVSKETTINATQNGGAFTKSKKVKTDKGKAARDMDSLMPEAANSTQNGGASLSKEGETHDEEIETDAGVRAVRRDFDELQNMYSNLAAYVKGIEAQHPCGQTLKRAFEFIDDEKAHDLESRIQKQRLAEAQAQIRRAGITKDVFNLLIGLIAG